MVFMGNGRAKQGHNTVAEHLIDSALEAVHSVHDAVDGWIEQLLGGFGIKTPDDFSPRLKPGVSWVRTKQETPNALPTLLAPPFLPIAKARGISEDLDEVRHGDRRQNPNDGDHNHQFDERKTWLTLPYLRMLPAHAGSSFPNR